MRALRYHGPGDLRVDNDVPEPQCKPHEIKIKPAFVGICGTDVSLNAAAQTGIPIHARPLLPFPPYLTDNNSLLPH